MKRILLILFIALMLVGCNKSENVLDKFSDLTRDALAGEELDIVTMDYLVKNYNNYVDKYVIIRDEVDDISEVKSENCYIYYIGDNELTYYTEDDPGIKKGDECYFLVSTSPILDEVYYLVLDVGK